MDSANWIWHDHLIDKSHTYAIVGYSYTKMDDFILTVEIDMCSRSFSLLSENGDKRMIKCDTTDEFMRVLRVCDQLLPPESIIYKELATQKDK